MNTESCEETSSAPSFSSSTIFNPPFGSCFIKILKAPKKEHPRAPACSKTLGLHKPKSLVPGGRWGLLLEHLPIGMLSIAEVRALLLGYPLATLHQD